MQVLALSPHFKMRLSEVRYYVRVRSGMLRFMGSQRVGHSRGTELNWRVRSGVPQSCITVWLCNLGTETQDSWLHSPYWFLLIAYPGACMSLFAGKSLEPLLWWRCGGVCDGQVLACHSVWRHRCARLRAPLLSCAAGASQVTQVGKEPICQYRRRKKRGFYPWVGRGPWRRK